MRAFPGILVVGLAALPGSHARLALSNPVSQSLITISDLAAKLQRQSDNENSVQTAFTQWCDTVMLQAQKEKTAETSREKEQAFADAQDYLDSVRGVCDQQQSEHDQMVHAFKRASATASHVADFLKRVSREESSSSTIVFTQASGGGTSSHTRSTQQLSGALPEVLNMVQRLAKVQRSVELSQLAGQVSTTMHAGGEDPMPHVRELIQNFIDRLEGQADEERSDKVYCDEEMAKAKARHADLSDTSKARAGALQEVQSELSAELASAASSQAKVGVIRSESHNLYLKAKGELQQGLADIHTVDGILQKYYAGRDQPDDAFLQRDSGNTYVDVITKTRHKQLIALLNLIDMLEMAVEQVSTTLDSLDEATRENCKALTKLNHNSQDAKKTTLRRAQHASEEHERDTVEDYRASLNADCIGKGSSFEERKAKREKEIAGLREALTHLNEEAF